MTRAWVHKKMFNLSAAGTLAHKVSNWESAKGSISSKDISNVYQSPYPYEIQIYPLIWGQYIYIYLKNNKKTIRKTITTTNTDCCLEKGHQILLF